ncbi:MFS transporter [Bacillus sp. S13(2024)]|uniref:MFS transporter n=1 Tax=unclassified Bacillus (in: firmicutes) TaxID=185979 RepID=UPI003D20052B
MKKVLTLFFSIMFVIGTDTFIISPLLPTLREQYHVSTDISGWMVSSYALGYAIFALIAGPISDGLNRKKVMIYGMIAFSVSTFLCGLTPNFGEMVIFRFIAGVSAAFVTPQVWASIPMLVPPQKIIKSMGVATAGLSVSQMLGLPIGGYLASYNWSIPFFTISGCALILIFAIGFTLPSIQPNASTTNQQSILNRYKLLFSEPKAAKVFFAYFLFQTGNFAAFSFFGTWLSDDFQLNVTQVGVAMLILGLGNTIGSFWGNIIIKKLGQSHSLFYGIILLAAFYVFLPYSTSITIVQINFFLMFFLGGLIFPLIMSLLQSLSTTARGTIAALSNTAMYAGTTIGASLGGFLYAYYNGFQAISIFTTIMFLLSAFTFKVSGILSNSNEKPQNVKTVKSNA